MNIIVSETGIIHGRGSDRFKWVSGLTAVEREAVKNGHVVLVKDSNPHHCCTPFKQVTWDGRHYHHHNYPGGVDAL